MKLRWISALLTLSSLVVGYAVVIQHRQLVNLRAEQGRLVAQLSADGPAEVVSAPANSGTEPANGSISPELLRLRSEVNQLTERKRGLFGVSNEHARLVAELASRQTNSASGSTLPMGYIRKRDAQLAGYNTPEDTVESFLWALQNRNLTNLLQALTPSMAEQMGFMRQDKSAEAMFKEMEALPGMRVVSKTLVADDLIEFQVEMIPGMPPEPMRFQRIDGHWRMSGLER